MKARQRFICSILFLSIATALPIPGFAKSTCLEFFVKEIFPQGILKLPEAKEVESKVERATTNQDSGYFEWIQELQENNKNLTPYLLWEKWQDNETDFLRFIRFAHFMANKNGRRGVEMYGIDNYKAWKEANDYLNRIPKGEFRLDLDVLSEAHRLGSKGFAKFWKSFPFRTFLPGGFIPNKGGVLKRRASIGKSPLFRPITIKEKETLEGNPWLGSLPGVHGFLEVPFKAPEGRHRGVIVYATPSEVRAKLQELSNWYEEMAHKAHRGEADPIEIAATVQYALVSIHPFVDGNGRFSRLIMDRILSEFDLPPAILRDSSDDIFTPLKDWIQEVRLGVAVWQKLASSKNRAFTSSRPNLSRYYSLQDVAPSTLSEEKIELLDQYANPYTGSYTNRGRGSDIREILIQHQPFRLKADGFFYDSKELPYVYHEGKLYPVSDRTYGIYMMWEKTRDESDLEQESSIQLANTGIDEVMLSNLGLLESIIEKTIDPNSVEVVSYSTITKANQEGGYHFFPWQREIFEKIATIETGDPLEILKPWNKRQSAFEQASQKQSYSASVLGSPAHLFAQYQYVDHKFWELEKAAKTFFPDLVSSVRESRRKIHWAARKLISQRLALIETLSEEEQVKLKERFPYRLFKEIFDQSYLTYETFDKAVNALGDEHIVLFRSDASLVRQVGFRSQEDYLKLAQKIPGFDSFLRAAKEFQTWIQKDPKNKEEVFKKVEEVETKIKEGTELKYRLLRTLVLPLLPEKVREKIEDLKRTSLAFERLFYKSMTLLDRSEYDYRPVGDEYDRFLSDLVLHAQNASELKFGISFSSASSLYERNTEGTVIFTNSDFTNAIHLVRAPRKDVTWNDYSQFANEYEFIGVRPIMPWKIIRSITPPKRDEKPSSLDEKSQKVLESLKWSSY